jgi:hypothetical protein
LKKRGESAKLLRSEFSERQANMARRGNNHRLRWRSKKANKGRKPSKGRVKGWSVKHYGIHP